MSIAMTIPISIDMKKDECLLIQRWKVSYITHEAHR